MTIGKWGGSRSGAGRPFKKFMIRDGESYGVNTPDGSHTGIARVIDKDTIVIILEDGHEIEILKEASRDKSQTTP